jgi:hypothetical protein
MWTVSAAQCTPTNDDGIVSLKKLGGRRGCSEETAGHVGLNHSLDIPTKPIEILLQSGTAGILPGD